MTDPFGTLDGKAVHLVTLTSDAGLRLRLTTLGARLVELWVPDRTGTVADVVLGHDRLDDYLTQGGYLGATCGRVANRIAQGQFWLDGVKHQVQRNEGDNQLHGGPHGWDRALWDIASKSDRHVTFAHHSPDGDMGFPGTVQAQCTYRIDGLRLSVEMTATTDTTTVVNMVHHSYFNLAGQGAGSVMDHQLQIVANHYLPVDAANIPTGAILPVADTAFDFRTPRPSRHSLPGSAGFDHCFCLSAPLTLDTGLNCPTLLRPCARLTDPSSGRSLAVWTNQPGVQVYTGAHLAGTPGKAGAVYNRFAGVALETQGFPDSPNHPQFPSVRLDSGQVYRHLMVMDFTPV